MDHSAVQELVDLGMITRHEAERHPGPAGTSWTRALGLDEQVADARRCLIILARPQRFPAVLRTG